MKETRQGTVKLSTTRWARLGFIFALIVLFWVIAVAGYRLRGGDVAIGSLITIPVVYGIVAITGAAFAIAKARDDLAQWLSNRGYADVYIRGNLRFIAKRDGALVTGVARHESDDQYVVWTKIRDPNE